MDIRFCSLSRVISLLNRKVVSYTELADLLNPSYTRGFRMLQCTQGNPWVLSPECTYPSFISSKMTHAFSPLGSAKSVISLLKQDQSSHFAITQVWNTELSQQGSALFRKQWQWLFTKAWDVNYLSNSHEGADSKCKSKMASKMEKWR